MKNLFLLFLVLPFSILAQLHFQIENNSFTTFEYRNCAYNDSTSLYLPVGWELYRTLNDQWNGVRDSTECIGLVEQEGLAVLPIEDISTDRPIFLRALITDENKPLLLPDWLYSLSFGTGNNMSIEDDCSDGSCSKLIVGVEIPNADTTGTSLRIYEAERNNTYAPFEICLPTEYFEENFFRELVFQLQIVAEPDVNNNPLVLNYFHFSNNVVPGITILRDTLVPPAWSFDGDATYNVQLFDVVNSDYGDFLVAHDEDSYPQAGNTTYLEIAPALPAETQQTINIMLDYSSLIFAPFTSIRGTMVEGSDSLRHFVNLFMPDYLECLPFIDVAFNSPVSLVMGEGGINFSSSRSCFSFSYGGQLSIPSGTHRNYGENGIGLLALNTGGRIVLHPNSSLLFNNKLILTDHHGRPTDQTWVELPRGSKLSFGPLAHLQKTGAYAETGYMKLNVLMNGGELDDHLLPPEERKNIRRIYPKDIQHPKQLLRIMPNPASGQFDFELKLPASSAIQWSIFDTSGRRVLKGQEQAQKGISYHHISIDKIPAGVYFLQVKTKSQVMSKKLIISS